MPVRESIDLYDKSLISKDGTCEADIYEKAEPQSVTVALSHVDFVNKVPISIESRYERSNEDEEEEDYGEDQGDSSTHKGDDDQSNEDQSQLNYVRSFPRNPNLLANHPHLPAAYPPIRTIINCTPRNTKPPIREPNMPVKQDKKEEKKEKKKKKPVIRMEGGVTGTVQNEATVESKLHDNLDVANFQWGVKAVEEAGQPQQSPQQQPPQQSTSPQPQSQPQSQQQEQPTTACYAVNQSTTTAAATATTASTQVNAVRALKNWQATLSAAQKGDEAGKDPPGGKSGGQQAKKEGEEKKKEDATTSTTSTTLETLKKMLKSNALKETSMVDEEYNIPSNANFEAEINAWKDLVQKSKVPLDPSKEDFTGRENDGRMEMLSIRPEPPEPKLDVQAVPTTDHSASKEEEDEGEGGRDAKGLDGKRAGPSPNDAQKLDAKKLHTGPFFPSAGRGGYAIDRKCRDLWILDSFNGVRVSTLDYSTNAETDWGSFKKEEEADEMKVKGMRDNFSKDRGEGIESAENGASGVEARQQEQQNQQQQSQQCQNQEQEQKMGNFGSEQQSDMSFRQKEVDADFGDSLNTIAEKDIEMSLNNPQQESPESKVLMNIREDMDIRKHDTDDNMYVRSEQGAQPNMDYGNPYEDDFYPGYESMTLESPGNLEKNKIKRNHSPWNKNYY